MVWGVITLSFVLCKRQCLFYAASSVLTCVTSSLRWKGLVRICVDFWFSALPARAMAAKPVMNMTLILGS